MDTTTNIKPKTMAELLPGLSGILSKDSMLALTAKKQPRQTIALTGTAERVIKPLTIAEMRSSILALKVQSPRRNAQGATNSKKKNWNSSVKVDKTISHTSNGQMKHNPVRKVLQFQPKHKILTNRATMAPETPIFSKPEFRPKKTLQTQARNNVRISGICKISETPVVNKPIKSRVTVTNKENIANQPNIRKLSVPKPTNTLKKPIPAVPDTPLSNKSWKSSCDDSFLQKEKEINDIEEKIKAISETQTELTLENIAEITPPASTPFKDYRSVQEYFNNSSELENSSAYHDNTIMCFDKPSDCKEKNNREESVIVSLCDLLSKASVTNPKKISTELDDLLQIEAQTEHNLKMIDNSIAALNQIKELQVTSLQYVRNLIKEKKTNCEKADKTLTNTKETPKATKIETVSPVREPAVSKACSVIKSCAKSPSYKIPKKNMCLRKKVFYRSMPNVSNEMITPVKTDMGSRALSMYMKMKENMKFLNTPKAKRHSEVPDTPTTTSNNLQKQLDKLYDEN